MKWFKHISDSLDDPFIQDLMDEFGSDGYLVFFGTLEILSREFSTENPGKVTVSHRYFRRKLRLSWHKCSTILKFCEEEGRFFVKDDGRKVEINCPKLKDMCDDWTNRLLRSKSEASPKKHRLEEEVEEDNNKDVQSDVFYLTKKGRKLKNKRLESFERFWNVFNYKKGKPSAADAWYDIQSLTDSIVQKILAAAAVEAKNRPEMVRKDRTPKMAQGWISDRRWEDEESTSASRPPRYVNGEPVGEMK